MLHTNFKCTFDCSLSLMHFTILGQSRANQSSIERERKILSSVIFNKVLNSSRYRAQNRCAQFSASFLHAILIVSHDFHLIFLLFLLSLIWLLFPHIFFFFRMSVFIIRTGSKQQLHFSYLRWVVCLRLLLTCIMLWTLQVCLTSKEKKNNLVSHYNSNAMFPIPNYIYLRLNCDSFEMLENFSLAI